MNIVVIELISKAKWLSIKMRYSCTASFDIMHAFIPIYRYSEVTLSIGQAKNILREIHHLYNCYVKVGGGSKQCYLSIFKDGEIPPNLDASTSCLEKTLEKS